VQSEFSVKIPEYYKQASVRLERDERDTACPGERFLYVEGCGCSSYLLGVKIMDLPSFTVSKRFSGHFDTNKVSFRVSFRGKIGSRVIQKFPKSISARQSPILPGTNM